VTEVAAGLQRCARALVERRVFVRFREMGVLQARDAYVTRVVRWCNECVLPQSLEGVYLSINLETLLPQCFRSMYLCYRYVQVRYEEV